MERGEGREREGRGREVRLRPKGRGWHIFSAECALMAERAFVLDNWRQGKLAVFPRLSLWAVCLCQSGDKVVQLASAPSPAHAPGGKCSNGPTGGLSKSH